MRNSLRSWQDAWVGKQLWRRHILSRAFAEFVSGKAVSEIPNWTLHQSSHSFATRIHGCATKTKALAHEIPPAMQARWEKEWGIIRLNTSRVNTGRFEASI